jgi:DNA repair exonuclease SbcCD ATPase subunit
MVKIARLEVENVKRVQVVQVEPRETGLTILGGRNKQGKTSVLDAIMWALGGASYKPSQTKRVGSAAEARVQIELDNGLVVSRDGKNGTLKVVDPSGQKAGQALLDDLVGKFALDLPKFMRASSKEKAEFLLGLIGVGDRLVELDRQADLIYNERHALGQVSTRKRKHAEDLPFEQGVPAEEVSASELIQAQQKILARNGENQRLRLQRDQLAREVESRQRAVDSLKVQLEHAVEHLMALRNDLAVASQSAEKLQDDSTTALENSLQEIDEINRKVRINLQKAQAEQEAADLEAQVSELTVKLEQVRAARRQLLNEATLPLPGLSIENSELVYESQQWDCMSSSDQLRVAVAIARQSRPGCQFVLLDKLEQMDLQTLREFSVWLESEGLQAIATRVSTGDECSLIIEDGLVVAQESPRPQATAPTPVPQVPSLPDGEEGF